MTKRVRKPSQHAIDVPEGQESDSDSEPRSRRRRRTAQSRSSRASSPDPGSTTADIEAPSALSKREKFNIRYKTSTRSDAEVLEVQKSLWTSDIYSHYRDPEIVRENDEEPIHQDYASPP
ncbi:hypothetical protein B0H13DRAFT_1864706 [Mycena leptocephala]|nr:hypothetical protein B0H13DRAFT_1864706 [Mycena leptocephala]